MNNYCNLLKCFTFSAIAVILFVQMLFAQDDVLPKPVDNKRLVVSFEKNLFSKKTPRTITIPDVGEYKVLKGDLHLHTVFSDGLVMPQDRVQEAVDNGLDVIAITDHLGSAAFRKYSNIHKVVAMTDRLGSGGTKLDQNIPYILAKPEADKQKVILVPGVEIGTDWARHFNALFITDANAIAAAGSDWKTQLAAAAEQGAFIHWNHPAVPPEKREVQPFADAVEQFRLKGQFHGVEVFTRFSYYPSALDWCSERDLAPLANSDNHLSEWEQYGLQNLQRPITLVLAKERTFESAREAFFAKRTIGWAADMIFGQKMWVEKLFRAGVEIKKTDTGMVLRNISDIPCVIETDGKILKLPPKGSLEIGSSKKITVSNWFIGAQKPLEIIP